MNADIDAYIEAYTQGWRTAAVCGRPDDTPPEQLLPPNSLLLPQKPNHLRRRKQRKSRERVIGKCMGCGRPEAPLLPPGYTLCRWCGWGRTS